MFVSERASHDVHVSVDVMPLITGRYFCSCTTKALAQRWQGVCKVHQRQLLYCTSEQLTPRSKRIISNSRKWDPLQWVEPRQELQTSLVEPINVSAIDARGIHRTKMVAIGYMYILLSAVHGFGLDVSTVMPTHHVKTRFSSRITIYLVVKY